VGVETYRRDVINKAIREAIGLYGAACARAAMYRDPRHGDYGLFFADRETAEMRLKSEIEKAIDKAKVKK